MKILIPTDFSDNAKVAVLFAVGIATQLKAELILLHVVHVPGPPRLRISNDMLEQKMMEIAQQDMANLVDEVQKEPLQIASKIVCEDYVDSVINSYIKEHTIDMVIMGWKGASGLEKIFMGSTTLAVIDSAAVPVMVVPESAHYHQVKNLLYASDFKKVFTELEDIKLLAQQFHARLTILHVTTSEKDQQQSEVLTQEITDKTTELICTVQLINDVEVATAIEQYALENSADLIVLFTHKSGFFEELMGKSITRKLAFHSTIPLLVINNRL